MTNFTKIDLAKLPAPLIVQTVSFEAVVADLKADFLIRYPDALSVIDLESEPVTKMLEVAAYRETILLNRINQGAQAVMLATSTGADLDNLAALIPLTRLAGESDEAFAARIQLAPEAFSTAGPRGGYEFHARSVSAAVGDVYVDEPTPGAVDVYILPALNADPTGLLPAIDAVLNADEVRPLTDFVSVKPFVSVEFTIDAQLDIAAGPDSATVIAASNAALQTYLAERRKFGRDVTRAGLLAALVVSGVENVLLVEPAADVVTNPNQVAIPTGVSVTDVTDV